MTEPGYLMPKTPVSLICWSPSLGPSGSPPKRPAPSSPSTRSLSRDRQVDRSRQRLMRTGTRIRCMCWAGTELGEPGGAWARCIIPSCEDTAENKKPSCQCYTRFVDTCICQGRKGLWVSAIWPVHPASCGRACWGQESMSVCFSTVITTEDNCHGREDDGKDFNYFSAANM